MAEGFKVADAYVDVDVNDDTSSGFARITSKAKTWGRFFGFGLGQTTGQSFGEGFTRDANGRLHDILGRFAAEFRGDGEEGGRRYGFGFGRGFLGGIGGIFRPLLRAIPLAGALGQMAGSQFISFFKYAAFAGLGEVGVELVNALLPAVGALGVLPAAIGALVVSLVTLKLALSGVGDALKAGLSGDTAAFNEALKKLSPSAQLAAKSIVGLQKATQQFKKSIQESFFAPFAAQIAPLATTWLPILRVQLGSIAGAWGRAFGDIILLLRLPEAVQMITQTLSNMAAAVDNLTGGLRNLIAAFIPIGLVGSEFLPLLTAGFSDLTRQFATFVIQAQQSGALFDFIAGGLAVLGDLFKVLSQIGSIVVSLFTAASQAGGDLLGIIGGIVTQVATFLKTTEGMDALRGIFAGLAQFGDALGKALIMVLPVLAQVLQGLAPLVGMVAQTLLPALAEGIKALAPMFGLFDFIVGLAQAIAPLLPLVGQLAAVIGTGLASVLEAIMPALQTITSTLVVALRPVLPVITQLFATLAPIIGQIADVLAQILVPVMQMVSVALIALGPVLNEIAVVIGQFLVQALTALQPLFVALVPVFTQWVQELGPSLVPLVKQLGDLLLALLPILPPLVNLLIQLLPVINATSFGFKVWIPILTAIAGVLTLVIRWISEAIGWIFKMAAVGAQTISSWVNFKNAMMSIWNSVVSGVRGLRDAVVGQLASMMGFIRGIPGQVLGAIGNLGNLLVDKGRDVVRGLWNGIQGMGGWLRDKILGWARSVIPGPIARALGIGSPSKVAAALGRWVPIGLAQGMQSGTSVVEEAARRIAGAALPTLATPGGPVGGGTGGGSGGRGGQPMVLHALIQIGERPVAEIWQDLVTNNNRLVANTTTEGRRRLSWSNSPRART